MKNLFRRKIPRLHPVVGVDSDCNIIYGRYHVRQTGNNDGYIHDIWCNGGLIASCFAVRKITEEQLLAWTEASR